MHALEPGELAKVTLEKHEGQESAPYCLVRAQSMKEQRSFAAEYDTIFENNSRDDFFNGVKALFQKHVVSFHGYRSEELEEAFSKDGMVEILRRLLAGRLVTHEEKKS